MSTSAYSSVRAAMLEGTLLRRLENNQTFVNAPVEQEAGIALGTARKVAREYFEYLTHNDEYELSERVKSQLRFLFMLKDFSETTRDTIEALWDYECLMHNVAGVYPYLSDLYNAERGETQDSPEPTNGEEEVPDPVNEESVEEEHTRLGKLLDSRLTSVMTFFGGEPTNAVLPQIGKTCNVMKKWRNKGNVTPSQADRDDINFVVCMRNFSPRLEQTYKWWRREQELYAILEEKRIKEALFEEENNPESVNFNYDGDEMEAEDVGEICSYIHGFIEAKFQEAGFYHSEEKEGYENWAREIVEALLLPKFSGIRGKLFDYFQSGGYVLPTNLAVILQSLSLVDLSGHITADENIPYLKDLPKKD